MTGEPTDSDRWSYYRDKIKQLYLVDNLTREKTRLMMKDCYQFDATDRQYKSMFKKWQWQKTLSLEEKKFIVLKTLQRQQQEDSRPTKFVLCGQGIRSKKLLRERKRILASAPTDLESLPRNLVYYTPPNSPSPSDLTSWPSDTTNEDHYPTPDKLVCITCVTCERDCYGFSATILANFADHLANEHGISLSATSTSLVSCLGKSRNLTDCIRCDFLSQWTVDDTFPDLKHIPGFMLLSSVSVIQKDPLSTLWLVQPDYRGSDNLQVLGMVAKQPDLTPASFLDPRWHPAPELYHEAVVQIDQDELNHFGEAAAIWTQEGSQPFTEAVGDMTWSDKDWVQVNIDASYLVEPQDHTSVKSSCSRQT